MSSDLDLDSIDGGFLDQLVSVREELKSRLKN
jgi:hypothetical protein